MPGLDGTSGRLLAAPRREDRWLLPRTLAFLLADVGPCNFCSIVWSLHNRPQAKRYAARPTDAGNSSGLVQSVLGVNSKPSRYCVLVLSGQAEPTPSFDGKVEASARSTRGQCTAFESCAPVVALYNGITCCLCYTFAQ